jgi:DNA polymerase-3 subunit delta'
MLFLKYKEKFPVLLSSLVNARRAGRMAHGYLLHGDNHVLREELAILTAQIALCASPESDGTPCGKCDVCDKLERGAYPELNILRPSGKMRFIKVGDRINPEVNTLRWFEDIFYKTTTSQYSRKVGIIYDADRMNGEAQNAFLKTLEEPPSNTFFILTTGNPSALLPTTRSRCQLLMALENRTEFDFEGFELLLDTLRKLSFEATGDLIKAEQCAGIVIAVAASLRAQAESGAKEEWSERLDMAQELENAGKKRIEEQYSAAAVAEYLRMRTYFLSVIHTWFAQLFQLGCGAAPERLANPEFFAGMDLPENIDTERAAEALRFTEELIFNLKFNVDESLALRSFCLNVAINS